MNDIKIDFRSRAESCTPARPNGRADGAIAPPPKFTDPDWTAKGEKRASVPFAAYDTLWFNTGTICNLACANCYIESSPKNDRFAFLTRQDVRLFLDEARALGAPLREIGFTGGEPFVNPDIAGMIEDALLFGAHVLVLTNAMTPMRRHKAALIDIGGHFPGKLTLRVSLDHYTPKKHEAVRGKGSWRPAIEGLKWLARNGFDLALASRRLWGESEESLREGYNRLCKELGVVLDTQNPARLVLFPEMEPVEDVPEITESCWRILGKDPDQVMCANERMVVRRKGAEKPVVLACTLIPYDPRFEMGSSLAEAAQPVKLNHSHCARFCVLGGASCNARA